MNSEWSLKVFTTINLCIFQTPSDLGAEFVLNWNFFIKTFELNKMIVGLAIVRFFDIASCKSRALMQQSVPSRIPVKKKQSNI